MNRTPLFTSLLWTAVGAATAAGCETEEPLVQSNGPAAVVPAKVEFAVDCGDPMPESAKFQVINSGNEPLQVRSATATAGFIVTADLPISVQPGATITIEVRPSPAVIGTDLGGTVKMGELTLDSDDPNGAAKISLRAAIKGANLVYVDTADKVISKLTLSSSTNVCPAPVRFFIKNTGNDEVHINTPAGDYPVSKISEGEEILGGAKLEFSISPDASSDCAANGAITYVPMANYTVCSVVSTLQVSQLTNGTSDACFCGSTSGV